MEAHLVPLIQVGNQELADLATRSYYRTKTFVLTNEIGRQRSVDPGHFMGLRYPARTHLHCIRHLYIQFKTGFELRQGSATLEDMLLETRFSLRYLLRSRKELDLSKVPHSQSSYQNHPGWRAPNNVVDTRWQDAFPCLSTLDIVVELGSGYDHIDYYIPGSPNHNEAWGTTCFGAYNVAKLKTIMENTQIIIEARQTNVIVRIPGCRSENSRRMISDAADGNDVEGSSPCGCEEEITAALQRMVRKCKRLEPPEASSS